MKYETKASTNWHYACAKDLLADKIKYNGKFRS